MEGINFASESFKKLECNLKYKKQRLLQLLGGLTNHDELCHRLLASYLQNQSRLIF